jgi:hypothetical protein
MFCFCINVFYARVKACSRETDLFLVFEVVFVVVVFQQPPATDAAQGCQIFLGSTYQNGKNIPNDHKIYQMAIQFNKWQLKYKKWP